MKDNWAWWGNIFSLGLFDLREQSSGVVLGATWFFLKPAMYIFTFWFARKVGLRAGGSDSASGASSIPWLMAGLIPWFYI